MTVSISKTRSLRSDIVFAFSVAIALYLAWLLRKVLVLLYVSALLAVVLQPLVLWVGNLRVGRYRPFERISIFILLAFVIGGRVACGSVGCRRGARP